MSGGEGSDASQGRTRREVVRRPGGRGVTVPGIKSLERPAAVLAVDGFRDAATAKETLLVGLSRARDQLVVCGNPELLRLVGGRQLLRKLRAGQERS